MYFLKPWKKEIKFTHVNYTEKNYKHLVNIMRYRTIFLLKYFSKDK